MFPLLPTLAHVPIEGWGDFANGAIHPVLNPGHALLIVGTWLALNLLLLYITLASSVSAKCPQNPFAAKPSFIRQSRVVVRWVNIPPRAVCHPDSRGETLGQ